MLNLTVHKAYFLGHKDEVYFICATNHSDSDLEVTHLWVGDDQRVHILTRPLPKRLRPQETFETFLAVQDVPLHENENPFSLVRARLSTGEIVVSRENTEVPTQGFVSFGTATEQECSVGCLWGERTWNIVYNYEFDDLWESDSPPCPHCHSRRVETTHRVDDETGEAWDVYDVYWTCPAIVVAYNEGGFSSTGVCLSCILEAITHNNAIQTISLSKEDN